MRAKTLKQLSTVVTKLEGLWVHSGAFRCRLRAYELCLEGVTVAVTLESPESRKYFLRIDHSSDEGMIPLLQ